MPRRRITFRQLETFSAVAQLRSFTRAAEALHLTQPAVSKRIAQLEQRLGKKLIEPDGRQIRLTPQAQGYGFAGEAARKVIADPRTNIQAGSRYLAWLINYFNGDVRLAVAAYNAGEGAVLKAGRRIPNYPETINYVRKVTDLHHSLKPPRTVSEARAEAIPAATPMPLRPPGRG